MISPMDRVEILCLRSELPGMIPVLQEQGVLHVEEVSLALENHPGFLHRVHLPEAEKAELMELEALESMLKESSPLLMGAPPPLRFRRRYRHSGTPRSERAISSSGPGIAPCARYTAGNSISRIIWR